MSTIEQLQEEIGGLFTQGAVLGGTGNLTTDGLVQGSVILPDESVLEFTVDLEVGAVTADGQTFGSLAALVADRGDT